MAPKRARTEAEELASMTAQARTSLANAGRALHDDVGPLLAGAGLWLSTVGDEPAVKEALSAIDQAMEHVRALSQKLNASPVDRMGLHEAFVRLQELNPAVDVDYTASANLSREMGAAIYDAASAAVDAATNAKAERIQIQVTGDAGLRVRITDNGRLTGRARALSLMTKLAEASGLTVTATTRKSTIVSIAYALRRSVGR